MSGEQPRVVDLYARLSKCPVTGRLENVDKQLADGRAVAERHGWVVAQEHRDNSLSAWRRGVRRPGWEAMLNRVEAGQVDGVVCWHTDRLWRQPIDLERLIQIGERGLIVASAYGAHDLSNADHRMVLRILVANACKASDDASRRIRSKNTLRREAGMTHGGPRAFGFAGRDRITGDPVPAAQVERERAALRQAAEDVAAGLPLAPIAAACNAAGLLSSTGAQWTSVTMREVLARGRNAGLVEHNGRAVGHMSGEPILTEELLARVRGVFAARRRGRVPGESYLASGIVVCGECGKPLAGRPHTGTYPDGKPRRQYHCPRGRGGCGTVAADVRRVDAALKAWTLTRLGDPMQSARLAAESAQSARRAAEIATEIVRVRSVREALGERLGRDEIDLDVFDSAIKPLTGRLAALTAERDALTVDRTPAPPRGDDLELAARWDDGEVSERRSLLLAALKGMRARLLSAAGRRVWSADRLRIQPIR